MRETAAHQRQDQLSLTDLIGAERAEWARPVSSAAASRNEHDNMENSAENQLATARVRRPQFETETTTTTTTTRADVARRIAAGQHQVKRTHIPKRATSQTKRNLSRAQTQQPSQQSICTAGAIREHAANWMGAAGTATCAPPSPVRASGADNSASDNNGGGGGELFEQNKEQQVAAPVAGHQNWDSPRRSARAISWRRRAQQQAQRTRTRSRLTPGQTSTPSQIAAAALIIGLLFCFTFCSCRPGASVQSANLPPSSSSMASAQADELASAPRLQQEPTRLERQLGQDEPNKTHRHYNHQHHHHHHHQHSSSSSHNSNGNNNRRSHSKRATDDELKLSHHVKCEPISQVNDLQLSCPHPDQFIVILEAYYSDRYPELICPQALDTESKLGKLSPGQLVDTFRQLYAPKSPAAIASHQKHQAAPIRWMPTLSSLESGRQAAWSPFCLDFDLKLSLQAKCSGRRECQFKRSDHQFPACVQLKPGHVFLRHLCIDDALLVRHCNANDLLASSGQLDFGFVMSPGYPDFYVTPPQTSDAAAGCSWRIGARPGQRVTVKLLDASLAPNHFLGWPPTTPDWLESAPSYGDLPTTATDFANHFRSLHKHNPTGPTINSTNILLEQLTSGPNQTIGLDEGTLGLLSSLNVRVHNKRIVFKIDQHDYHVIKLNLALKLEQISNRCLNYDQLVVRDLVDHLKSAPQPPEEANSRALDSATLPASAIDLAGQDEHWPVGDGGGGGRRGAQSLFEAATTMKSVESFDNEQELEMISKLPVSLYRNHLIDFRNETIFHTNPAPPAHPKQDERRHQPEVPRLDYKALLEGLNPLQLAWLYQHNVTLCSMSQLEQVSALQERQKVSFTSSANLIQLDLVAGRVFNPTNRGLLFWFHKHGCPQTRAWPKRSRLIFRNESLEVFKCLDGFVFSDTREMVRQRECNQQTQLWTDRSVASREAGSKLQQQQDQLPACVFLEDLIQTDETSLTSKFERLIVASSSSVADAQAAQRQYSSLHRHPAGGPGETPTEIVGVTFNKSQEILEISLLNPEDHPSYPFDTSRLQPNSNQSATYSGTPLADLMRSLMNFIRNQSQTSGQQSANQTRQLMEQRQGTGQSRWSFDLNRRLFLAVLLILSLFVLLNLIIYVIFLVAIPGVMRCLFCPNNNRYAEDPLRDSRQRVRRSPSTCKLTTSMNGTNKLAHYESDYSVSMGMSL